MTTTTNTTLAASIAMVFKLNDHLLSRAVDTLSVEELWYRPTDHNNPMFWLIGHVGETRAAFARILGETYTTPWGDLFGRGAPLRDRAVYPSFEEITRVLSDVNGRFYSRLESVDDSKLAEPATSPTLPIKTVADWLAFFALHDSYHVGQIAYIRKALGRPGLRGWGFFPPLPY